MEKMIGDKHFDNEFAKIFKRHGAFFAFSEDQFNENKTNNIEYVSLVGEHGIFCPKDNVENFYNELNQLSETRIKMNIYNYGIDYIIDYVLYKYIVCYKLDYNDAYNEVLKHYKEITIDMVQDRYYENIKNGKYNDSI